MKIALLTKEYPPHTYGGAGVHVAHLSQALARQDHGIHDIQVWCFGDQNERRRNPHVKGIAPVDPGENLHSKHPVFKDALFRNVVMVDAVPQADVIHCHTWYTHLAGCLLKQTLKAPLILTTHSLEPGRPWKREQIGSAYDASAWIEKTAYQNADGIIAVSESMKQDVRLLYGVPEERIEVIPNGIDADRFRPQKIPGIVAAYGIDPAAPYILMVSRLSRQKGILHFLEAARFIGSDAQIVLCASVPDTPEFMREVSEAVARSRAQTGKKIIWVTETVPVADLVAIYSGASLFVCPSIYEPFGIINLEAMACGIPVVASAVGGIPEVVVDRETGRLVCFEPAGPTDPNPKNPRRFAQDLATAIDALLGVPETRRTMGRRGRRRIERHFSWTAIAEKTLSFYRQCLGPSRGGTPARPLRTPAAGPPEP